MKNVKIELNKDVKSLLVKAINSETKLLELSHDIVAIMNSADIDGLKNIKETIKTVQKLKASKGSTLPAKLITICNKLISGQKLPKEFRTMTIEGIKASFVAEPKTVSAKSKKVAKGTTADATPEEDEDAGTTISVKGMNKEDLINSDVTLFSKVKNLSLKQFGLKIDTMSVEQLRVIEIALKAISS